MGWACGYGGTGGAGSGQDNWQRSGWREGRELEVKVEEGKGGAAHCWHARRTDECGRDYSCTI